MSLCGVLGGFSNMELSGVPRSEELFYSLGKLNCHYYSFKYVFVPFSSPSGMPIM